MPKPLGDMGTSKYGCGTLRANRVSGRYVSVSRHGGVRAPPPKKEQIHPPPQYDGPRPPKDAILISGTGQLTGSAAITLPGYEFLVPPKYGWIDDRGVWPRIGNHEVRATGGNLARVAQRRCLDCDS